MCSLMFLISCVQDPMEKETPDNEDTTVVENKSEKKNSTQSNVYTSSKYRAFFRYLLVLGSVSYIYCHYNRHALYLVCMIYMFRELDLSVFEMLKCGFISKAVLHENSNTEVYMFNNLIIFHVLKLSFLLCNFVEN